MLSSDIPVNQTAADIATACLLWNEIQPTAYPDSDSEVDTRMCLDVIARCEEHGVGADPAGVTRLIAALVADEEPGLSAMRTFKVAAGLIVELANS